jgi:hypothetical protein
MARKKGTEVYTKPYGTEGWRPVLAIDSRRLDAEEIKSYGNVIEMLGYWAIVDPFDEEQRQRGLAFDTHIIGEVWRP